MFHMKTPPLSFLDYIFYQKKVALLEGFLGSLISYTESRNLPPFCRKKDNFCLFRITIKNAFICDTTFSS